eukprot:TRINITY_DN6963_c0_g1_i2.p1 TRINITY_DN6963_c0_g1~~TRINITY_DN6963_c0_g1_i2.p1  ORF type:complete len:278 (-),score=72.20 TRINITY_DN6963_c0_g1_i2:62-895(-)
MSATGVHKSEDEDGVPAVEQILFKAPEMYVYKIPPRMSNLSYRADDWNINKWAWEGTLKLISVGTECTIRLEDSKSGELFAQASVKQDQPLPIEPVIDSSRFFVLRVEDTSSKQERHAFLGIGFRERTEAYDFQAALHDHVKFVKRAKEAEEVAEEYAKQPSKDYSLKPGEKITIKLDIPKKQQVQGGPGTLFKNFSGNLVEATEKGLVLKPPPKAAEPFFVRRPSGVQGSLDTNTKDQQGQSGAGVVGETSREAREQGKDEEVPPDDDFGDFQAAA